MTAATFKKVRVILGGDTCLGEPLNFNDASIAVDLDRTLHVYAGEYQNPEDLLACFPPGSWHHVTVGNVR